MTTHQNLTPAYDAAANQWRTKIEGLGYAAAYRWMVEACTIQTRNAQAIDVGCGTGDFSRALIEVAGPPATLTLLDPAPHMVETATRSLTHMATKLAPAICALAAYSGTSHDIVLCAHVIEHFDDPVAALRLLKGQLAPGGKLLLVVSKPHWCNWIIWVRWRHRMISPQEMQAAFHEAELTCTWDAPFPAVPPSRASHAYLVTHAERTPL